MTIDLDRAERDAAELSSLTREVAVSDAHPDGMCATHNTECLGCGLVAPVAILYGGPMADCEPCGHCWAVVHDPVHCWQRRGIGGPEADALVAERVREATPPLLAARALLQDLMDTQT